MAEDLGEADEIVLVVGKELVGHRVPQQVWVQVDSGDCGILVAEGTNASIRQWPTLPDEDLGGKIKAK